MALGNNKYRFEDAVDLSIEFMTDGARIYTVTFEDGKQKHFITTPQDIRQFLAGMYDKYNARGDVFDSEEYEERREKYILSIGGEKE